MQTEMNDDPFGAWTTQRRMAWLAVLGLVCLWRGPSFVGSLRPRAVVGPDFVQEWVSARNWREGMPVYAYQPDALSRHLGGAQVSEGSFQLYYNAHPPTSVLLALPFAWLGYSDAFLVWNLLSLVCLGASLWLIVVELRIVFAPFSLVPLAALLLMCNPLRQQINQGQLNLVLLVLLTGVWVAARRGRLGWAGTLLGVATALKLFPGFLFLYFVLRREWRAVGWGTVGLAAVSGATLAALGAGAYVDYVTIVVPHVSRFSDWWMNASLAGFWNKLFDGASGHVVPLVFSPTLARMGWFASAALLLAIWASTVRRAGALGKIDHAFAVTLPAMLLLSPITWDHYFVLLLLPLALIWTSLPPNHLRERKTMRWLFIAAIVLTWLNPAMIYGACFGIGAEFRGVVVSPLQTIVLLEYQFYTLLTLFGLTCAAARRRSGELAPRETNTEPRFSLFVQLTET